MGAPRTAVHDRGRREVPGHTSTTFILHTHERLPRQEGRYQVTPTSVFTVCTMLSLCFLGPSPAAAGPDVCAAAAFWIFSSAWNARCAFRASLDVNRCSRPCAPECRGGCQGGGAPARAERGGAHRTAALPLRAGTAGPAVPRGREGVPRLLPMPPSSCRDTSRRRSSSTPPGGSSPPRKSAATPPCTPMNLRRASVWRPPLRPPAAAARAAAAGPQTCWGALAGAGPRPPRPEGVHRC